MRAKDVIRYALIVSYFAFFTAGYIVLDIWLCDLFHEFDHRHRGGDTRYGKAAFSFFLVWAIGYCHCFFATVFPRMYTLSVGENLKLFAFFAGIAIRIVFFIRFSTWLSHFRIREEKENVAYCIACLFALAWGLFEHIWFYRFAEQWWVAQARDIREKWRKGGNEPDAERMLMRILGALERMESMEKASRAETTGRAERIERDEEAQ